MRLKEAISLYLREAKAKGLTETSINTRRKTLKQLSAFIHHHSPKCTEDIKYLSKNIIENYVSSTIRRRNRGNSVKAKSKKRLKAKTLERYFTELKQFLKYLHRESLHEEDLHRWINYRPRIGKLAPRVLSETQVKKILSYCNEDSLHGRRDRLIFELLYSTGLRRSELVRLELGDLDLAEMKLLVREGKGRKDRVLPLGHWLIDKLKKYIREDREEFIRKKHLDFSDYQKLFFSSTGRALCEGTLATRIEYYKKVSEVMFSAHDFRRSFATHLLKNGVNIRVIQILLGHSKLSTTEAYTRVYPKKIKEEHQKHHPSCHWESEELGPYSGRVQQYSLKERLKQLEKNAII